MIWKTEPAPQPTKNLIQEQACALSQIEVPKLQTALGTTLTFFYITKLDV